jgi:hypothetical protein
MNHEKNRPEWSKDYQGTKVYTVETNYTLTTKSNL